MSARSQIDSRTRRLFKQVEDAGWVIVHAKHFKFYDPDGKLVATHGHSPSDQRSYLNLRATLRRAGLRDLR